MRQQSIPVSLVIGSICAVLLMATGIHAQDNPVTPTEPLLQPTNPIGDVLPAANQNQEKTFQQIVDEVRANEKQINKLFSSIPIGFPKKQMEQMSQIEFLKKSNEALKSQLEAAAFKAFRLDPKKNRGAVQLVFATMRKKLEVTPISPEYDPRGALEIAEMMLDTDLDSDPPGPVRLEDVAYQAFLASYAIEDYARADLMLKKIEDKGLSLQPSVRQELTDAQEKWQRELMIRRLESNTDDLPRVKLETSEGDIVVELFENHAPQTVGNFIYLVDRNFYDELPFFLVQPGRIAQTGCPTGDGSGDAGYYIPSETDREQIRHHFTGTLSMANSGRDTGGSQFFITHQRNGQFDGKYTAFGRVIEGMDVVYRLKIVNQTRPVSLDYGTPPAPSIIHKATVIRKRDHTYAPTRIEKNAEANVDGSDSEPAAKAVADQNSGG